MTEEQKHEHIMSMQLIQEECKIDIEKKIAHPPVAISYGVKEVVMKDGVKEFPIPIGTYGNFSFIQAPPKSMKTFFISLLSSAYANPECDNVGKISSFRGDRELIHFDTEQGDWHSQRVFQRVKWMNIGYNLDFYHTFALRKISHKSRVDFIDYYLLNLKSSGKDIGLVIIDGVADLVADVNNIEDCNEIVQKIMSWTTIYDCHIVTVIHSNYGSDKPTGHLGSALEKKAETQIKLDFNKETGLVEVDCKRSRNTPFNRFHFELDSMGLPKVVDLDDVDNY